MQSEQAPHWYLRKFEKGEIFGPVSFDQIREWATSAQINPQDAISSDRRIWTKAPMISELGMDWLIEVSDNAIYGPTTEGTLLEFLNIGEIAETTPIVNCCNGERMLLREAPFFLPHQEPVHTEPKNSNRIKSASSNLSKRIHRLESALLEKQVQYNSAKATIDKLRHRIMELEQQNADLKETIQDFRLDY